MIKMLLVFLLSSVLTPLSNGADIATDNMAALLSMPIEKREDEISHIIQTDHLRQNKAMRQAALAELQKSFDNSYPITNRDTITELVGRLKDPNAIPLFISHLKQNNPSQMLLVGTGKLEFKEEFPYANAFVYFGKDAVKPLIDAVAKSNDPAFDELAFNVISFTSYDAIFPLLECYKTAEIGSKSEKFITRCYRRIAPKRIGNNCLDEEISSEKDPLIRSKLLKLKSDFNTP